jgi:hypothetical protein
VYTSAHDLNKTLYLQSLDYEVLFDFATEEDEFGLPYFRNEARVVFADITPQPGEVGWNEEWNEQNAELLRRTLLILYDELSVAFLEKWFLRCSDPTIPLSNLVLSLDETELTPPLESIREMMHERQERAASMLLIILDSVDVLLQHKLLAVENPTRNVTWDSSFDPPPTLIRIWDDHSHTQYDHFLGLRCGNWKQCQPANNLDELCEKGLASLQDIQNHCESKRVDSNWISFSNDALWVRSKLLPFLAWKTCKIAIINTASLNALRIPWGRSDNLVEDLGGHSFSKKNKKGVAYAWGGHFLVYGWIPKRCIMKVFSSEGFIDLCNQQGIKEGITSFETH